MKKYMSLGSLLLGIWLIAMGVIEIFGISYHIIELALDILAVVTGILILIGLGSMNWVERLGMIFLAVWLILVGLMPFIGMGLPFSSEIAMVLALLAGILLLLGMKGKRAFAKIGLILLAVWLIASAVIPMLSLSIPAGGLILAILGIVAGIFILIGR